MPPHVAHNPTLALQMDLNSDIKIVDMPLLAVHVKKD